MANITVANGETLRLNKPLSSSDTVTVQAGGVLVADRLSFITPAADIVVDGTDGLLEIRHMPPVMHTEFSSTNLVLEFTDAALPPVTLNTAGTQPLSNLHPEQIIRGNDNSTFLLGAAPYPPNQNLHH